MMDKYQAIRYLYPSADPRKDFMLVDNDGAVSIAQWNVKDASGNPAPEPTDADLQAAWDAYALPAAQAAKKAEVSAAVGEKIVSGYQAYVVLASTGKRHFYGTDQIDQSNMAAARQWSNSYPMNPVLYRPQDQLQRVAHTKDEFIRISDAVFSRVNWYLDQGYAYYRQIFDPAATVSSVNAIIVTINDPSPTVPTGLAATAGAAGSGTVNLSWAANTDPGAEGFNVYVDGSVQPVNSSLITGTTFSVTGLALGAHTFQVASVSVGTESSKCTAISATVS